MADHHHHNGHHHHDTAGMSDARLIFAVALNMLLTVVEVVVGILSGSLSLIADAVHNFNDAAALIIAWVARRVARKKADDRFTFGYRRAELIGAMINLTTLVLIGLFLLYESVERFIEPKAVEGLWVAAAAGAATVVDVGTALLLWAMSKGSINVRAAFVHNITDAAASVAVVIGGLLVWWQGWTWVDPALTVMIALYILWMSVDMLRRTASILMNNVPPGLDLDELRAFVLDQRHVVELVHLHVWELDENHTSLEAQLRIATGLDACDYPLVSELLKSELLEHFDIGHATLEMLPEGAELPEFEGCA